MEQPFIVIGSNLREQFAYKDASFPFDICKDRYGLFPDKLLPVHWHDSFEFDYVLNGEVEFMVGNSILRLREGEAVFININVFHSARQISKENAVLLVTVFQPDIFSGREKGIVYQKNIKPISESNMQGIKITDVSEQGNQILKLLKSLENLDAQSQGYELMVIERLSRLWLQMQQLFTEKNLPIYYGKNNLSHAAEMNKMLVYIQEHYTEKIRISELAGAASIGRTECFVLFKQYVNTTPNEYINDYRLALATNLLRTTSMDIASIAMECGYVSQSYFGIRFRKKYGKPPLAYRNEKIT